MKISDRHSCYVCTFVYMFTYHLHLKPINIHNIVT